ncbi:probable NAD(P)H dehydrogenase subunit CRR3, chloroplastic [Morus notabilis]|uniref:probable NAD(P)H dehydrogenase subunit CRR3, chloroplastic n=1 Tax=Morus notabilis TaxID=981085 RepID=UPI000CED4079|nr:probable NAD(P)H dehydrogenase subunit CRR3, chloroplastic [Morus notabilis]
MSCLSCCVYMTTNNSNPNTNNDSPPPNSLLQTNTTTPLKPPTDLTKQNNKKQKKHHHHHHHKPRQPSVIEIERAIGAGRFRDADPRDLEEEKDAKFDMSTMSFPDKFEGSLQKQLREVGEWMTDRTEKRFRLSGKKILKVTFIWLLPIWTLSLLVASGAIKLPFSNQFLDQLIM